MQKAVRINTLGGFRVCVAGQALRLGRKTPLRPLALLKYLAGHAGHALPDAQVARALWPGRGREAALRVLAVTLHRLRRLLGVPEAIVRRQGRIAIDLDHVWCDAAAFDATLDQWARCRRRRRRNVLVARALALYRGDFLAGEPPTSWTTSTRTRLRERYLLACANL